MLTRFLRTPNPVEVIDEMTPGWDLETSGSSGMAYLAQRFTKLERNKSSVGLLGLTWTVKIRFGLGLICRGDKGPFGSQNSRHSLSTASLAASRLRPLISSVRCASLS